MKLLPLVISTTLFVIIGIVSYVYIHVGAYKEVSLEAHEVGPYRIIFSHHVGAYHKILESIEPVEKWTKDNNIECTQSFGEYLDDPENVAEERLQSNGGCIVINEPKNLPSQFSYREIPKRMSLVAEFDGAPSIGPMKVYPKAMKWIAQNHLVLGGPVIEIYTVEKNISEAQGTIKFTRSIYFLLGLARNKIQHQIRNQLQRQSKNQTKNSRKSKLTKSIFRRLNEAHEYKIK